ncbi:hypothetical protein ANCCAN_06928 [Ancylostoma caninum]|uniref:Uncharacterized protein n=1 Tax=Ancylostoma caninum TaxID=29170 RepID=A0A368GVK8_ANCCA|nr:hypothetical protein ANCCAN_06928 [Ancylostoma caninum]
MVDELFLLKTRSGEHGQSGQSVLILAVRERGEGHVSASGNTAHHNHEKQRKRAVTCSLALMEI